MVVAVILDPSLRDMDAAEANPSWGSVESWGSLLKGDATLGDATFSPDTIMHPVTEELADMEKLPEPLLGVKAIQEEALALILALSGALAIFFGEYAPGEMYVNELHLAVPSVAGQSMVLAAAALASMCVALLTEIEAARPRQKHRRDKEAAVAVAVAGIMCVVLLQNPIDNMEATEQPDFQHVARGASVLSPFHAGLHAGFVWFGDENYLSSEGLM